LARAIAVLGQEVDLGRAARLAALAFDDAEAALDGLVEIDLVTARGRLVGERPAGQQPARTGAAARDDAWETKVDRPVLHGECRVRVERCESLGEAPSNCELGRRHRRLQREGALQIQGASSAGGSARAMISSAAVTRLVGWWVMGRTVSVGMGGSHRGRAPIFFRDRR
jgi:hypothetical protein